MKLEEAITEMLYDLDLADRTKETYRYGLENFVAYIESQGEQPTVDALYERVLYDYRQYLRANKGERTVRTYLSAAKVLFGWLNQQELLPFPYERAVSYVKNSSKRTGYAIRQIPDGLRKLLDYYVNQPLPVKESKRLALLRNRALVYALYDTGCRITEMLSLNRDDVQQGKAEKVYLSKTKGEKPRVVFLTDRTRQLIQAYLAARSDGPRSPLFISGSGKRLSRRMAWHIVRNAAIGSGIEAVSPHMLRHQRAQDMLDAGISIEWVAAYLGHKDIDTTRNIYAPKINEGMLKEMVDKCDEQLGRNDDQDRMEAL